MDLTSTGAVADFGERLRFARALGVRIVNTNISIPEKRELFISRLADVAKIAFELELQIGLEAPGTILPEVSEYRDCLRQIETSNVVLNFDVGNVFTASLGTEDSLSRLISVMDLVGYIHLKDAYLVGDVWRFAPLSHGEIDYRQILKYLSRSGKSIPMTIEMPLCLAGKGKPPLPS